jgi:hypothetical protein
MADSSQPFEEKPSETEILLAQYEFARENRNTADTVAWEMTAITWGGQTLLLGFVLEAIDQSRVQPLIPFVAFVGVVLSIFNHRVMSHRRSVCNAMVSVCNEIEAAMEMQFQPQHRLDAAYPPHKQSRWFLMVNYLFAAVWAVVAYWAIRLHCSTIGAPLTMPLGPFR